MSQSSATEETIRQVLLAARLLFVPGDVVELRVPKAGRYKVISGYFDDLEKLAEAVAQIECARHPGVYWTLNPVMSALLARASNKVKQFAADTTKDDAVIRRRWLPVDLDPVRPSGISSTDGEHGFSLELGLTMRSALAGEGWPEPIFADSGNGAHLLYPVDLPNDAEAEALLQRVLRALAARFNTASTEVDLTTFNSSRIFKVYGTTARKGDSTADRPHRLAHVLEVPALLTPVSLQLLRVLASTAPAEKRRNGPVSVSPRPAASFPRDARFDMEAFLGRHGIRYRAPVAHEGGRKFVLEECPWDASHKAPDAAVFEKADGVLGFHCFHSHCESRTWRDFRDLFEPRVSRGPNRPGPAPAKEATETEDLPLSAADVEAAIDLAIEKSDLAAGMRLIPEIARLPIQSQVLIQGKLRLKFKRDFPAREFSRAVRDLADKYADPPPPPPEDSDGPDPDAPDLTVFPLTDSGNGERIVALYPNVIRFCTEFDKWLVWDGRRWKTDAEGEITQKAKRMARLLHDQAGRIADSGIRKTIREHARSSESQKSISNALKRAASEQGIPVSANELDVHKYLLNCLNGVVDVRTGELLQFEPKYLITKLCHVKYNPAAKCLRFLKFINWSMGESPDDGNDRISVARLVGFLQKSFGYALTADVSEKAAFIFYGKKGNNGKTTLLTVMTTILSEYATQLDINTLMTTKFTDNNIRADLAKLHGARLVITSEVDEGQRLSERLMKYLTAGMGKVTACRKFENPFEFEATHKIFMDANYRPKIHGADEAIWARLLCVPFQQHIAKEDPELDKRLKDKILAESEGVLAWLVKGAMRWAQEGLGEIAEVKRATTEWRDSDDPIKEFLEDCCEVGTADEGYWVLCSSVSATYEQWVKENHETRPLNRSALIDRLELKGFTRSRSRRDSGKNQLRTWEGFRLKDVTPPLK